MPSTGFIGATNIVITDLPNSYPGTVTNGNNLLGTNGGNATLDGTLQFELHYEDVSTYIPAGSTITGIKVKYKFTPTTNLFLQFFHKVGFSATTPFIQDYFQSSGGGATAFTILPASNDNEITFETNDQNSANTVEQIDAADQLFNGSSTIINDIITGNTILKLQFEVAAFEYANGDGSISLNGDDNLPGLEIIYDPPPTNTKTKITNQTKVKIQPATIFTATAGTLVGPNSHGVLGDVGDGETYTAPSSGIRARLLETATGVNACTFTSTFPNGFKLFNFFDNSQIPLNAVIRGITVVAGTDFDGTGESYIGTFGTNSGTIRMECRLYNGINYSDRLTWDSNGLADGIELESVGGGTNNRAAFTGGSKKYKNDNTGNDDLFGGPNDLSGLDWDPALQADFGVGFAAISGVGTTVAGVIRGIRMRVHYQIPSSLPTKVLITN